MLFERTAISKKPEETIKKDLNLSSNQKIMTESLFIVCNIYKISSNY
ncbi:hypothetical protein [Cetobacterium sp.]